MDCRRLVSARCVPGRIRDAKLANQFRRRHPAFRFNACSLSLPPSLSRARALFEVARTKLKSLPGILSTLVVTISSVATSRDDDELILRSSRILNAESRAFSVEFSARIGIPSEREFSGESPARFSRSSNFGKLPLGLRRSFPNCAVVYVVDLEFWHVGHFKTRDFRSFQNWVDASRKIACLRNCVIVHSRDEGLLRQECKLDVDGSERQIRILIKNLSRRVLIYTYFVQNVTRILMLCSFWQALICNKPREIERQPPRATISSSFDLGEFSNFSLTFCAPFVRARGDIASFSFRTFRFWRRCEHSTGIIFRFRRKYFGFPGDTPPSSVALFSSSK